MSGDPSGVELERLRKQLDETDRQLVELAARRQTIVARIGEVKRLQNKQLRDFARERAVLQMAEQNARRVGLDPALARGLLERLIDASLESQEGERVRLGGRGQGRPAVVVGGGGRMGRWFARFLDAQGFAVAVDDPAGSPEGFPAAGDWRSLADSEAVLVLATPLRVTARLLEALAERPLPGLVVEIGSLKSPLAAGIAACRRAGQRLASLHPMFGPSVRMLAGRHVVLVDTGDTQALEQARELFRETTAELVTMSLDAHDRLMAWVLGLAHALNIAFFTALARCGESVPGLGRVSSTTFAEQLKIARGVASESAALYWEIQHENPHGAAARGALAEALAGLDALIRDGDEAGFVALMHAGAEALGAAS